MDEVIEFLPDAILIYGKEYRDFWMIPHNVSKEFDPILTAKIVNHLIKHEVFLTNLVSRKTVPLGAYYFMTHLQLPVSDN